MNRYIGALVALLAVGMLGSADSQTLVCTPLPSPDPSPSPEPSPSPAPPTSVYVFETKTDLVATEPRLWFGVQNGSTFDAWSTNGTSPYFIPALEGNPGTEFAAPCTADSYNRAGCSASTAMTDLVRFDDGFSPIYKVSWRLTWYPRSSSSDVRLVLMDSGFANPVVLGTTEGAAKLNQAYTVGGDITAAWNAHVGGPFKYLGFATRGNGSIGPVIYQLRLTFTHRIALP